MPVNFSTLISVSHFMNKLLGMMIYYGFQNNNNATLILIQIDLTLNYWQIIIESTIIERS